jgi:hypothetical protein
MRVIRTHVPASIITADGGHWHCVSVTIDGEPVEIWAPIYSPAAALQRLTEAVVLPAMRADEAARQHDYAQGYDVAVKAIGRRDNPQGSPAT